MTTIAVLGAGLVGGPVATTLAGSGHGVKVADINQTVLQRLEGPPNLATTRADLSNPSVVRGFVHDADVVISAMPEKYGFEALKAVVGQGKNVVDFSFYNEDPRQLDGLAKQMGVTAIVDMGVAPGMNAVLTADAFRLLDSTRSAVTYVGGLPVMRGGLWQYKNPFSAEGVLKEYLDPARIVRDGRVVSLDALSVSHFLRFDQVGLLEASVTDGLRSMTHTLLGKIPHMAEYTMRYPGHYDLIRMLIGAGLLSEGIKISVNPATESAATITQKILSADDRVRDPRLGNLLREAGFYDNDKLWPLLGDKTEITPFEFASILLSDQWRLHPGQKDVTIMRVVVQGMKDGKPIQISYDLFDEHDGQVHSMARTTGFAAISAAEMVLAGMYTVPGITFPEQLGTDDERVSFMLASQKERGVNYVRSIQ